MYRLTIKGSDGTQHHTVLEGKLTIGRDPASTVCLKDSQVSWKHAALLCSQDRWMLEDLRSSNGTFIGSARIERHALRLGETILIGPYELYIEVADARKPTAAFERSPSPVSASERTVFESAEKYRQSSAAAADPGRSARHFVGKLIHEPHVPDVGRWVANTRRRLPLDDAAYRRSGLRYDVIAGLTVAALMIPQGMAYALLAGLPPVMGLYAAVLPMIVYALVGSGPQTSVGPVTVDSLIMVLGLTTLAVAGTSSYITLAVIVTLLIGTMQLAMSGLRLGFLVNFLSYPVLAGFTSAVAIITALGQLKHLFGIRQPQYLTLYQSTLDVFARLGEAHFITLALASGCIVALWAMRRWLPIVPAPLSVLAISTAFIWASGLDAHGVEVLGIVQGGVPHFGLPEIQWTTVRPLLPLAATMALVGFSQTFSIGKSLGNRYGYDVNANRELTALGLSNLAAGVSQGYAVSGSLARSATNAEVGAKTPLAAVVCALVVALVTLFFTPLFHYVPQATLAAILIVSSVRLIDTNEIRYLFKVKITEGVLLLFTFVVTLVLGIMPGLLLGIVASILLFIALNTRPNMAILGRLPNTNIFRNVEHFPEAQTFPGLVIVRIDASLYFANVEFLKEKIRGICDRRPASPDAPGLKAIILDGSAINDLDSSADTALHQLSAELRKAGIEFYIAGIKAPVREVMKRSGLYTRLGGDHFFFTIDAAVKRFQEKIAAK